MDPHQATQGVRLVLNPWTGHVSPQFHVNFFETVKEGDHNYDSLEATWKSLSGLVQGTTFNMPERGSFGKTSLRPCEKDHNDTLSGSLIINDGRPQNEGDEINHEESIEDHQYDILSNEEGSSPASGQEQELSIELV